MKKTLYVVLRDIGLDLGEGYSSSSSDEFVGVVNDFQTARNIIEYFIDQLIGEIDEDRSVCKSCPKDRGCHGCEYYEHGTVQEDDWDEIYIEMDDWYNSVVTYHFKRIEVEV